VLSAVVESRSKDNHKSRYANGICETVSEWMLGEICRKAYKKIMFLSVFVV